MKKALSSLLILILALGSFTAFPAAAAEADADLPYDALAYYAEDEEHNINLAEAPEGASYDLKSNTLTLTNVKRPELWLEVSGCKKAFTLVIVGECELDYLWFPSAEADILIDGTGTLTVNQNKNHSGGIYAYNRNPNSDFTVEFGKDVKLHLYGSADEPGDDHAALLEGYTGGIVFGNGKAYDNYTASIYEHDTDEYVNLFHYYEGDGRWLDYQVTCASDPEGIYTVRIYDGEEPPEYSVRKFYTIEGYDGYGEVSSFGEYGSLRMTEEEFLNSDYSFVYETPENSQPAESTVKKELYSPNSWGLSGQKLYVDRSGNRYVKDSRRVNGEWVTGYCSISDDQTVMIPAEYINMVSGSEVYYIPGDFVDVDPNELSTVKKHVVTDQMICQISGTEFLYNFDEPEPVILGDPDGDGDVTILDATCIQRCLADLPNESFSADAADVDKDGDVSILDATAIQRHLAGLPTEAQGIAELLKG